VAILIPISRGGEERLDPIVKVKGKLKFVYIWEYNVMTAYRGNGGKLHTILNTGLNMQIHVQRALPLGARLGGPRACLVW
jgi:hypothetical protein